MAGGAVAVAPACSSVNPSRGSGAAVVCSRRDDVECLQRKIVTALHAEDETLCAFMFGFVDAENRCARSAGPRWVLGEVALLDGLLAAELAELVCDLVLEVAEAAHD